MNASSPHKHSFRLFARPSFLEGVARIFDFANVLQSYRYDRTEHEADAHALSSDWMAVGDDLRHAIRTYAASPAGAVRGAIDAVDEPHHSVV